MYECYIDLDLKAVCYKFGIHTFNYFKHISFNNYAHHNYMKIHHNKNWNETVSLPQIIEDITHVDLIKKNEVNTLRYKHPIFFCSRVIEPLQIYTC